MSGLSTDKQYIIGCTSKYRMRRVKDKGAILIVVWNIFAASVYSHFLLHIVPNTLEIVVAALGITLPFAGWLADIRFGRYKVIRWSMWIMWMTSILTTTNSVLAQLVTGHRTIFQPISQTMVFIMAVTMGGYQANVIQLGLDQLQDASTSDITSFIIWFVWTYYLNATLFEFTHLCLKDQYHIIGQLTVCVSITVIISSSFLLDSSLTKEPVTHNPIKLIYQVIRYALNNKYPRCRSAFTYCEDELPSRIDFGKSKYGGPFTTEQVEDVKTFLRSLSMCFVAGVIASKIVLMSTYTEKFAMMFQHAVSTLSLKGCYTERSFTIAFHYAQITLLIPLHEFIIYPLLHKYYPSIKIYQKILAGILIQIARVMILMTYDIMARKAFLERYGHNITVTYNQPGSLSWTSINKWMAIPNFLSVSSTAVFGIACVEFLASQTPYSMRGLVTGAACGSIFFFCIIGYGIYWPFTQQWSLWDKGIISCNFWYLLSVLLVLLIFSILFLTVGKWYKNRKREDVLPNEHIFAERYYAQED